MRRSMPLRPISTLATGGQLKRVGDLSIAAAILIGVFPLLVFVALAIKAESPGPVFDHQGCVGRGGRRFQLLKFRTVIYEPDGSTPPWTRRTTNVGSFLRQTRIDMLPQLLNVIRGEISIIDRDGVWPSFLD
jgi:lipopolysaccharide/colanic/teichoic acid biosynthesis glycosyltransferase